MSAEHQTVGLKSAKTDPDLSVEDRVEAVQDRTGDVGLLLVAEEVDFIRDGYQRLCGLQKKTHQKVEGVEFRIAALENLVGALEVLGNGILMELQVTRVELGRMRSAVVKAVDELRPEAGSDAEGGN